MVYYMLDACTRVRLRLILFLDAMHIFKHSVSQSHKGGLCFNSLIPRPHPLARKKVKCMFADTAVLIAGVPFTFTLERYKCVWTCTT